MPTEANALYNLRTAVRNVRERLSLSGASAQWTNDQVTTYNLTLAQEILAYPQSFTPEILDRAALVAGRNYTSIEDAAFAWGQFGAETLANAPAVLDGLTNKLIIAASIIAVVYVAGLAYGQKGAPAA